MKIITTDGPVFVEPYRPDQGGTDFLGLRQVNVDLMDECLPGINNVSSFIRPFSLISWIYWKFYHLAAASGIETPTDTQLQIFQEKTEVLFTWGHILEGVRGIPGTDSRPPRSGRVPLDFESWKRIPSSTSLMAAVQYGPPAKTSGGLGFIEPVPRARGMYRTTGLGIELAEALEASLRGRDSRKLLGTLSHGSADDHDAHELFPAWSILTPTKKEKDAFRLAYFDDTSDDTGEPLRRRSATLKLILSALANASGPLTLDQVRYTMFHNPQGGPKAAKYRWIALQVRQAQRLAMETILLWIEERLNRANDRETGTMISKALERRRTLAVLPDGSSVHDIRNRLFPKKLELEALLKSSDENPHYCLFELMNRIRKTVGNNADEALLQALRVLYICAEFTDALEETETVTELLQSGGAERVSMAHWRDFMRRCDSLGFDEFLRLVFEQYVISQHLAVAARRFDGGTQRLRITIEDRGLTALVSTPLPLNVTPDRLEAALYLMSDCGMVQHNSDGTFSIGGGMAAHFSVGS